MPRKGKIKPFLLVFVFLLCTEFAFGKGVQKVVIDAGHGGKDAGTTARSRKHRHEKHITLAIANKLGKYIEENYPEIEVIYTRKKDVYLTLNQRAEIANKADADLFISIHVDAVGNKRVKGASVYVLGLHRTEDNLKVAMRENAVMLQEDDYQTKYAGFNPNDAESYVIFSLMQNQYLNNSMTMASFANKHLKSETQRRTKGIKQAGFYVLREVGMPSILVETGYITNTSDANYLCSENGQKKTAKAIFNAFKEYKDFMDKHTVDLSEKPQSEDTNNTEDTYFTVQLLFSSKDIPSDAPYFKGLSPIFKYEENKGNRYTYGRTKNYQEALKLQQEAKETLGDAYLIGFHQAEMKKASEIRDILNGK